MNDYEHILTKLGYSLEKEQPHLGGERRIFAAHKMVLFGRCLADNLRVVIKVSNDEVAYVHCFDFFELASS